MSKLTKFQDSAVKNTAEVKGGFFFNSFLKQPTHCAPVQPTYCAPAQPTYCAPVAPKPVYHAPCTPVVPYSFSWKLGKWC
jgi:hypothetical protein